jgi:hypothetical protein
LCETSVSQCTRHALVHGSYHDDCPRGPRGYNSNRQRRSRMQGPAPEMIEDMLE